MHLILQGYFYRSPWHTLQRYSFTRLVITTMNDWRHHRELCVVRAITLRPSQATRYVQSWNLNRCGFAGAGYSIRPA